MTITIEQIRKVKKMLNEGECPDGQRGMYMTPFGIVHFNTKTAELKGSNVAVNWLIEHVREVEKAL